MVADLLRPKRIERKARGVERRLRHGGGVFQDGQQQPLAGAVFKHFQGAQIGIDQPYQLRVGTTVGPLREADAKRPGTNPLNDLLRTYGYKSKDDDLECDHVHEIQLGGPDIIGNLWPLKRRLNSSSGGKIDTYKIKLSNGKEIQIYQLRQHVARTGRKYFFKIQSTL